MKKIRKGKDLMVVAVVLVVLAAAGFAAVKLAFPRLRVHRLVRAEVPQWVDVQLLTVDGSSRRGTTLEGVNDIVIHYVGNPGTSAQQNHDWYANPESEVSSHFIVGLEGEVIQCLPLDEISSATNWRNSDTISIEVCHPSESGEFNDGTYEALTELIAWLLDSCGLDETHIIRHYDVTGKQCPRYFVENEAAWEQFRSDVVKRQKGETQ